jgi:hypothetical protein
MARRETEILEWDFSPPHSGRVDSHRVIIARQRYETELCKRHLGRLKEPLEPFTDRARRIES